MLSMVVALGEPLFGPHNATSSGHHETVLVFYACNFICASYAEEARYLTHGAHEAISILNVRWVLPFKVLR